MTYETVNFSKNHVKKQDDDGSLLTSFDEEISNLRREHEDHLTGKSRPASTHGEKCASKKFSAPTRPSIYRTYSSYGFKNLKKDDTRSQWSLLDHDSSTKEWSGKRCVSEKELDKIQYQNRKRYELADFQRCLKLLGLHSHEHTNFSVKQHRNRTPDTKKVKPRIVTRLTESTISSEEINDALLSDFESNNCIDPRNRSFLAKAVYEKWYFNKQQEQRRQQKENELKNELMKLEFERMRCEQKLKAEKSYKEWMEKKKINQANSSKPDSAQKSQRSVNRKFLGKDPEEEYIKWRKFKEEEYQKKKKECREKQQNELENMKRRKMDANKAFTAWQNRINEDLKKKLQLEKKKAKSKIEEEIRSKEEKQKEANTSFNAWKQKKMEKLLERQEMLRKENMLQTEARTKRLTERLYEAELAFYEWINNVDKRISASTTAHS